MATFWYLSNFRATFGYIVKQLFLNLLAQSIHAYQPRNKKLQVRQGRFISSHDCVTCPLEFFFFSFSSKTTEREMGRLYAYCWNRSPTLLAETTNHQALVRLQKWRQTFIPEENLGHWDLRWDHLRNCLRTHLGSHIKTTSPWRRQSETKLDMPLGPVATS